MILILSFLAKLSIIISFILALSTSISDILYGTSYLSNAKDYFDFGNMKIQVIIALISIIYLLIFLASFISKFTRYSQKKKVKTKNGELEVTLKTINDLSKDFLITQEIIKNARVKSRKSGRNVIIEATVDTYKVENLSQKLSVIQERMTESISKTTGISVKSSIIKVKKVINESVLETEDLLNEKVKVDIKEDTKENIKENTKEDTKEDIKNAE